MQSRPFNLISLERFTSYIWLVWIFIIIIFIIIIMIIIIIIILFNEYMNLMHMG